MSPLLGLLPPVRPRFLSSLPTLLTLLPTVFGGFMSINSLSDTLLPIITHISLLIANSVFLRPGFTFPQLLCFFFLKIHLSLHFITQASISLSWSNSSQQILFTNNCACVTPFTSFFFSLPLILSLSVSFMEGIPTLNTQLFNTWSKILLVVEDILENKSSCIRTLCESKFQSGRGYTHLFLLSICL